MTITYVINAIKDSTLIGTLGNVSLVRIMFICVMNASKQEMKMISSVQAVQEVLCLNSQETSLSQDSVTPLMQILMISLKGYLFTQCGKCFIARHARMDTTGMKIFSFVENAQLRTVSFAHHMVTVMFVMKVSLSNLTRQVAFPQLRTVRFQLQSNHKDSSKIMKKEDSNAQCVRQVLPSILKLLFVTIAQTLSLDV